MLPPPLLLLLLLRRWRLCRALDKAMSEMDVDNSGDVDFEEFSLKIKIIE